MRPLCFHCHMLSERDAVGTVEAGEIDEEMGRLVVVTTKGKGWRASRTHMKQRRFNVKNIETTYFQVK